eukprot:COSAG01_NODE_3900_length_5564_cov_6.249405_3_plen_35_part_00
MSGLDPLQYPDAPPQRPALVMVLSSVGINIVVRA